ncbi:MAG TPA: ABC transporter substrate-binding protein [Clostridiales bacterium]|nr:ABC transporter substrate-binding protein [Clostridiales bacterium]
MKKAKKYLAILLILVMVLALAACGGNKEQPKTPDASNGGNVADPSTSSKPDTSKPEDSGPKKVRIAVTDVASNVSPWAGTATGRHMIIYNLYQPLLERDKPTGEIKGILMDKYEKVSANTYHVTIHDNIYDGENNHVTADDVIFSIEMAIKEGNISGLKFIDSAKKVDDYTVEIVMKSEMDYQFASSVGMINIVTKAAYEASPDGMSTTPVSTAPYELTEWSPGTSAILTAKKDYWGAELADPSVKSAWHWFAQDIDVAEYTKISEPSQMSIALETGTIDIALFLTQNEAERFMSNPDYNVHEIQDTLAYNLFFNCGDNSVLSDKKLRQAICYAIDAEAVRQANGGYGTMCYTFGSSEFVDNDPSWKNEGYYEYDRDAAEQLVKDSNYNGEVVRIMVSSADSMRTTVAEVVQGFLLDVGINAQIDPYDSATFAANKYDETLYDIRVDTNSFECLADLWNQFLSAEGHKDGKNYGHFYDETLQGLLDNLTKADTYTPENIKAAHEYIKENAFAYSLYSKVNFHVSTKFVEEYVGTAKLYPNVGAWGYNFSA